MQVDMCIPCLSGLTTYSFNHPAKQTAIGMVTKYIWRVNA